MPTLSLTKLVTSQDTFGEMVEKINTNFDIISQAQGIKGEEGKRGASGVPGPPGLMGPQGLQGANGQRGSRWHFASNVSSYSSSDILNGDFFLEGNSGTVYERTSNNWLAKGTITSATTGGESSLFDTFDTQNGTIIKPKRTNYTLEITDIKYDSIYQATSFLNPDDTADYTFATVPPVTTTSKWLQEMGLKIYTSEADSSNSTYYGIGKNMHLANSLASLQNASFGWDKKSGFTLTVDWDYALDSVDRHLEVLRIKSMPSGNVNHKQRIELSADRLDFNADFIHANAPIKIYNVDRTSITPELGTIVYDTNDDNLYAYVGSSPSWLEIQTGAGGGSPTYNFDTFKIFDGTGSADGSQIASSGNTTLRLKEGTGILITSTTVNDPTPKQAWEISLASSSSPGTNDFGSAKVYFDDSGTQSSFTISSTAPGSILNFEEGSGIKLSNSFGKIKISTVASSGGTSTFQGFKYIFGQTPSAVPINSSPLSNSPLGFGLSANNDGTIVNVRTLRFPTAAPDLNFNYPGTVIDSGNETFFRPNQAGYWQINAFAFGLLQVNDEENPLEVGGYYTVAGMIQKNREVFSHVAIAESSFMNPYHYFVANAINPTGASFSSLWPTWTINCSDIVYLDENDYVSIGVGLLYAPDISSNKTLWYMSGFISGHYLGNR